MNDHVLNFNGKDEDGYDWDIDHPDCVPIYCYDDDIICGYECGIGYLIMNIGTDAFGDALDDLKPGKYILRYCSDKWYSYHYGVYEYDEWIEIDET